MNSPETKNQELDETFPRRSAGIANFWVTLCEVCICTVLIVLICGERTPDINESHYLTKAKHFWNPDWCPNDFFLSSADAHFVYFLSLGWVTKIFSLSTSAWLLRGLSWLLFAFAWQRLSFRLFPQRFASLFSITGFLLVVDYFHLAGEWVVGGAEAKSFAYIFVILALERMVAGKWNWVWIWLGIASMFHVLVGGWSLLFATIMFVVSVDRSRWKSQIGWMAGGAVLTLLGLVPGVLLSINQDAKSLGLANEIYVRVRLPHHLYFWSFEKQRMVAFFVALATWVFLSRGDGKQLSKIHGFCLLAFALGLAGIGLSNLSDRESTANVANWWLRFYLFRMTDFAIGIGIAFAAMKCWQDSSPRIKNTVWIAAVIIGVMVVGGQLRHKFAEKRPPADVAALPDYGGQERKRTFERYKNWLKVCDWAKRNTPDTATFLTPFEQQTFNWYAHRSQVFCRKDIPQNATGILDWQRRIELFYQSGQNYQWQTDDRILELAKEFDFQYIIVEQAIAEQRDLAGVPSKFKMVYPDDPGKRVSYVVFEITDR